MARVSQIVYLLRRIWTASVVAVAVVDAVQF
jgi:hypothetical protein